MESHPVPQNITAFEFHLFGPLTVRQFGYLVIGLVIAYISFILFFNKLPLLAWPLMIIPSVVGAAYAFLPIMERPLDYWTKAFIKAIKRPTLRKYHSKTVSPEDPKFKDRLEIYLHLIQAMPSNQNKVGPVTLPQVPDQTQPANTSPQPPTPPVEVHPTPPPASHPPVVSNKTPDQPPGHDPINEFLQNLGKLTQESNASALPSTPSNPPAIPPSSPTPPTASTTQNSESMPSKEELDKTVQLAREAQLIQNRILESEKQINEIKSGAAQKGMDPKQYTQQFQSVLSDLQKLNQKAREISHELAELSKTPTNNAIAAQPAAKPNIIPTLTLTSTSNIINGIVTDSQGNYLEGAIIVAHDKGGIPVRALKTNKLGQFIAATPLPSGTYTISVEKDDLSFDIIQVDLDDKVLNPIVISAKKGAV